MMGGRTMDLLPYQQAWIDDRSPLRFWAYDRQIGASTAVALDAVAESAHGRVFVVVPSMDDAACMLADIGPHDRSQILVTSDWASVTGAARLLIFDNAIDKAARLGEKSIASAVARIRKQVRAERVAIVEAFGNMHGGRGLGDIKRGPGVSVHRTRLADALEQGMGRKVACVRGVEWTQAWEDRWYETLRELVPEYAA